MIQVLGSHVVTLNREVSFKVCDRSEVSISWAELELTFTNKFFSEFYPSELRSVLAGLTTMLTNIMMALVVKTFTNMESLLGHSGVIWLYSAACFGAILLTLSYIPETKDKSLTVIHDKFARLRKPERASPWVTPLSSPSVNSVRKFQYKSQMFTQ